MPDPYLSALSLSGRRVVVIGAGRVAERRLQRLLEAGADLLVIAPAATREISRLGEQASITWAERRYRVGDLADAWYVITATGDPTCDAQVSQEADQRKIFCVRADDAGQGSAWTPATATADDMIIAVSSRDAVRHGSPRRTAWLRDQLAARLGELLADPEGR